MQNILWNTLNLTEYQPTLNPGIKTVSCLVGHTYTNKSRHCINITSL